MSTPNELPNAVGASWRDFLESYEPLRPELYRYCRHLTGSAWDAEDLAQDALARAFVTLAQLGEAPPNPRAWLFRVASNAWIDQTRRMRPRPLESEPQEGDDVDPRRTREAAGTLLSRVSPQERAALVLKDAFDFSLEEVAVMLSTSVGAIKAALHRARAKLAETPTETAQPVRPAVLDAFCRAFNAGDIDAVTALLLEDVTAEVVGATTRYGREEARRTVVYGMLFGVRHMADPDAGLDPRYFGGVLPTPPRVELVESRGDWLLLHWYSHETGEAVRAVTRVTAAGDQIARVRNYFYNPDVVAEVSAELGLSARSNGYNWWGVCSPSMKETP